MVVVYYASIENWRKQQIKNLTIFKKLTKSLFSEFQKGGKLLIGNILYFL